MDSLISFSLPIEVYDKPVNWVINWLCCLGKLQDAEVRLVKFMATLWCLWAVRNSFLFRGESFNPQMFFNLWSLMVSMALQSLNKDDMNKKANLGGEVVEEESSILIREGMPFYKIGGTGLCEKMSQSGRWMGK